MKLAHMARRVEGTLRPVCGAAKTGMTLTTDAPNLIEDDAPCQRCLEWVVEQGQLATRRLEQMRSTDGNER